VGRIEPKATDKYKHPVIYGRGVSKMRYFRPGGKMAYSQISIRLGGLMVELGTEATYPDMVSDLTGRCLTTFKDAMDKAVEAGVDVSDMRLITSDYGDDDDED
jgi:hypothetical protein